MKKNVTIYDVAKAADVGIGTVSRVLNDSQKVSDKTRKKVLKIIKELNYRPNSMARGLALQKTNFIGVIVPYLTHHFFVEILGGVQNALQKFELDLVLFDAPDKKNKQRYIDRILKEKRLDGLLAITMDMTKEEVEKFNQKDIPLVLVDDFQEQVTSIFVDDIKGTKKAIEHLVSLNHTKIAFLNGSIDSRQGKTRLKGVKSALESCGLKLDPALLKIGDFTEKSGYEQMKQIIELEDTKRPTAVFTASDNQAVGSLQALEEAGLSVPNDFALIGFDDIELARYLKISTIKQPLFKMGQLGIDALVDTICQKNRSISKIILEPELVIRKSCG